MHNCKVSYRKSSVDDLKVLAAKGFIIPFESGVCVIRDWKKNNYLQKDRVTKTTFVQEKQLLTETQNKSYALMDTSCIQNVSNLYTQNSIDKNRLDIICADADKLQAKRKQT